MSLKEYKDKLLKEFNRQRKIDRSKHFNEKELELIDRVYKLVIQTIELDCVPPVLLKD